MNEIRKKIKALSSPERAAACLRYFKTAPGEYGEGDIFLGLNAKQMHGLAKEYQALALTAVVELLQSPFHEERAVALLILVRAFGSGDEVQRRQIYELYLQHTRCINNWDLVDGSAAQIVGAYLLDKSRKPLYSLVKSSSLWERRIAIIATFAFIRQDDFLDTLKLARRLLNDSEDLIHKAVGWMLREVGKRNQQVEETFLLEHYHRMPRTMLRYAIERFAEARRLLYLRGQL
ncbi:MAG: DNA alkylation repair protein [Acidobacteria bacterium]|nr:DNA alkylation repair protein [Acidobacteriota bacterium]